MSDDNLATLDKKMLTELIASISEVSRQVGALREQMARVEEQVQKGQESRESLAKDLRCLAKGVNEFKGRFEPYLEDAVDSQREWKERRSSLLTKVMGVGVLGALGIVAAAIWHYVLDIVRGGP